MKTWAICTAGACLLAMSAAANAETLTPNASRVETSRIQLAQTAASESKKTTAPKATTGQAKKDEPVKEKVKRAWKKLVGYKFVAACPAFPIVLNRYNCTETGKNKEDARAKCAAKHTFCSISDAS